jgi:hypothetical protein
MTEDVTAYTAHPSLDALWVEVFGRPPVGQAEGSLLAAAQALRAALDQLRGPSAAQGSEFARSCIPTAPGEEGER